MLIPIIVLAVTIGSAMSPIGNPQNLLVAINGTNTFVTFFKFLLLPTVINLFLAYFVLKAFYRKEFHKKPLRHSMETIKDRNLAILSKFSLCMIVFLVAAKIIIVLMESVWQSGIFQSMIVGMDITSVSMVLIISVLLSQLVSNVPLVALYLPMLAQAGASAKEMVALAAGSTIAGNLLILGAASNVIIIQNAEKRTGDTLTFLEFAKVGIPLTVLNVFVYWAFLA